MLAANDEPNDKYGKVLAGRRVLTVVSRGIHLAVDRCLLVYSGNQDDRSTFINSGASLSNTFTKINGVQWEHHGQFSHRPISQVFIFNSLFTVFIFWGAHEIGVRIRVPCLKGGGGGLANLVYC